MMKLSGCLSPEKNGSGDAQLDMKQHIGCHVTPTSKDSSRINHKSSSRSSRRQSKLDSNGAAASRPYSGGGGGGRKREIINRSDVSCSEMEADGSSSSAPSSSDSDTADLRKAKRRKYSDQRSSCSTTNESSLDSSASEAKDVTRRNKSKGSREKKVARKREKLGRTSKSKEKKRRQRSSEKDKDTDGSRRKTRDREKERQNRKERHRKHQNEGGKQRSTEKLAEVISNPDRDLLRSAPRTQLQATMDAQEQQKELIRRNAELAKARLASGELQRARDEQAEMQRLYGAVDWRAKKKLRAEKKRLERTIAAGNKLATIEEREVARMDAFRVALGLPTAEAQRQAEWRAEATRALAEQEAISKDTPPISYTTRPSKHSVIGPRLPPR
ncbi:unnamed protein product [Sphagnum jensenii]|uniref:Uncharacterized protein n=1 Tax=Sphagnum jensenii TaxID=128206 RepID=A0ABP0W7H8_9BRYO